MNIEELRAELVKISNDAPLNSHSEVADALEISTESLYKTRIGKTLTIDSPDNRERIRDMISLYRGIIKRELQKLMEYDN